MPLRPNILKHMRHLLQVGEALSNGIPLAHNISEVMYAQINVS